MKKKKKHKIEYYDIHQYNLSAVFGDCSDIWSSLMVEKYSHKTGLLGFTCEKAAELKKKKEEITWARLKTAATESYKSHKSEFICPWKLTKKL